MPPIKRWFPVSHDINADPEFWELRELYTDRAGFIWLEMLSIADRNDGVVGPDSEQTRAMLASRCRTSRAKVASVFNHGCAKGWLRLNPHVYIVKWRKYHRTKEREMLPPDLPDLPDLPIHKNESKISASPDVSKSEKKKGEKEMGTSMNLSPELKEQTDRLYNSDSEKFKRIAAWVAQGRKHGYSEAVMAEALRRFWDYRQIDDWYPYLDTILTKADKDLNRDEHDAEHRRHQEEIREASKMFLVK